MMNGFDKHTSGEQGLGVDWRSVQTLVRLVLVSTQLLLVTTMAAVLPLGLAQHFLLGHPWIQFVTVLVGAVILWWLLFYGWLFGGPSEREVSDGVPEIVSFHYVLRSGSKQDWLVYFSWAAGFYVTTIGLVFTVAWLLGLDIFSNGNMITVGTAGIMVGILTPQFALSYLRARLLAQGGN